MKLRVVEMLTFLMTSWPPTEVLLPLFLCIYCCAFAKCAELPVPSLVRMSCLSLLMSAPFQIRVSRSTVMSMLSLHPSPGVVELRKLHEVVYQPSGTCADWKSSDERLSDNTTPQYWGVGEMSSEYEVLVPRSVPRDRVHETG